MDNPLPGCRGAGWHVVGRWSFFDAAHVELGVDFALGSKDWAMRVYRWCYGRTRFSWSFTALGKSFATRSNRVFGSFGAT